MVSRLTMENSMWGVFHNQSALDANDTVDITLPSLYYNLRSSKLMANRIQLALDLFINATTAWNVS